jgi:hypothetical protein
MQFGDGFYMADKGVGSQSLVIKDAVVALCCFRA